MPPNPTNMNAPDFLVESIPNLIHGSPQSRPQNPWLAPFFPLLLSGAATALCYGAAGPSLGLFLGGVILSGLLTGPLVAAEDTWLGCALAAIGVVHGIAGVWLFAALRAELDLGLWAACYLVLDAFVLGITGFIALLRALRCGRIAAGALATILSLAWLMWPIWLSPVLHGARGIALAAWLVPAHPIFAANAPLRPTMGNWTEQAIAYRLTSLTDDVAYNAPANIFKCVLLHVALGVLFICIALLLDKMKRRRQRVGAVLADAL